MNVLSFDIEDWYHILDNKHTKNEGDWDRYSPRINENMDKIFSLMDNSNSNATFFCLGWMAKKNPEIIKKISKNGYEIGCHSDTHQLVYEQSKKEFEDDLSSSLKRLEDLTGKKIRYYRAPGFSLKENTFWALEILLKYGIEIDSSIFPAKRGHGGMQNFNLSNPHKIEVDGMEIKEFPINPFKFLNKKIMFTGGGYFRLLPLWLLKYLFGSSDYNMTYFHPRDFDPDQPMIEGLNPLRKFKSYVGLKSCYRKLDTLLLENNFIDIDTADKSIDWNNSEKISL